MSGEKEDGLGLSLSLGIMSCPQNKLKKDSTLSSSTPTPFPLNLLPFMHHHQISSGRNDEGGERVRGEIDMNEPARMILECDNEEEEGIEDQVIMVSSPNSTVSSVSGKRSHDREENEGERATSSLEDDGGDAAARKKLRLSKEQAAVLEETFKEHNTLNPKQKLALAKQLNLRPRQVEVWFQNRRARTKLKQTEVDCEYLKRCCENLTEENRRLQKEVSELRALKLSPQLYMNMSPPTTLTMCPQCERVAVSSSAASSSVPGASASRSHHVHPVGALHQQPVPLNKPWAAIISPKTHDVQRSLV